MKKKEELISVAIFVDRKKDEMIFIEFPLNIELVYFVYTACVFSSSSIFHINSMSKQIACLKEANPLMCI